MDKKKEIESDEKSEYAPKEKNTGTKIFRELCKDPTYPCRDCKRNSRPMDCGRIKDCHEYYIWFSKEWRKIRRALEKRTSSRIY